MIVAVDGYSSTGKSTVAKLIAARVGLTYIDTGAMYRVVTLAALRCKLIDGAGQIDEEALRKCLNKIKISFKYNEELKCYETYLNGENVESCIVREFLVAQQREMAQNESVIMDGRDIGSVVFPNADVKFFMTASPDVRAERRFKELKDKGVKVSYEEVKANVEKRDYIDSHREVSPLVQTEDAVVVDNSCMTIEEEVEMMVKVIESRR